MKPGGHTLVYVRLLSKKTYLLHQKLFEGF